MRSMFQELTDKEIDEFRKEAYVMSRLRHPNIVLVMGISLVDQEPVALPKSRSNNMSIDAFDGGPEVKKSKPQKTGMAPLQLVGACYCICVVAPSAVYMYKPF